MQVHVFQLSRFVRETPIFERTPVNKSSLPLKQTSTTKIFWISPFRYKCCLKSFRSVSVNCNHRSLVTILTLLPWINIISNANTEYSWVSCVNEATLHKIVYNINSLLHSNIYCILLISRNVSSKRNKLLPLSTFLQTSTSWWAL